jgi:hypothetical protein
METFNRFDPFLRRAPAGSAAILNSAAFDSVAKIAFLIPNLVGRPV